MIGFSRALEHLLQGVRVARSGWPQGRFLIVVPGSTFAVTADRPVGQAAPQLVGRTVSYEPHIDVVDLAASTLAVWHPTGADLLAQDWLITELFPHEH
ncbi:Protein of unknown function [Lentzea albidocapillata subsp. violacea]|uniref:Thoeris anti-defense 2-like domain-containing protein n=1 Tax=Lentzea albidocapillata subsp. violacea TaxID=128104 RepID=A0A1G9ASM0_9PSEU|nr:MW1434 family type I TA system toxin [Lentzea albidocapillata]SDK30348.1 Protein of unknown function [Lentzea albidocapillata subsp. violacea]